MEGKRLLEIKDLHTVFHTDDGAVRAVDGVDLWVDEGEVLGRRIRLREERHGAFRHAACQPARAH